MEEAKDAITAYIGNIADAPSFLVDNEYIKTGYRINYNSVLDIVKSMFQRHNELVNVWSHFIGMITFSIMIIYTIYTL